MVSGPSMLKIVLMPRCLRTGAAKRIAGWKTGANINPKPFCSIQASTSYGSRQRSNPRASKKSALPQLLDTDRLPCLATFAPAALATKAAAEEILSVPVPSPPVPTGSTQKGTLGLIRMAASESARTPPVNSSEVSPFTRRPVINAAISISLAWPVIIWLIAS